MIIPRHYQKNSAKKAWSLSKQGKNVFLVGAGGCGKTVIVGLLTRLALREEKSVLIVCPTLEIVQSTVVHLSNLGITSGVGTLISGHENLPDFMRVCVAGIHTLSRRDLSGWDVVIVDEAHHSPAKSWDELLLGQSRGSVFGLSATPVRLDGVGFDAHYDEIFRVAKTEWLIKKGWVAKPKFFTVVDELLPDLKGVPGRGDYNQSVLESRMDKEELSGGIIENWKKHAHGQMTIGFAVSIQHAEKMAVRCRTAGISSRHVDGEMSQTYREDVFDQFRSGRIKVLWTCDLANEGLNVPQCRAVILARPTKSYRIYIQQVNRCTRPGSTPVVLDHAKNVMSFGFSYVDREFSLTGELEKLPEESGAKKCPECDALVESGEMTCPECGYEFPARGRRMLIGEKEGDLMEVSSLKKLMKAFNDHAKKHDLPNSWIERAVARYKELRTG